MIPLEPNAFLTILQHSGETLLAGLVAGVGLPALFALGMLILSPAPAVVGADGGVTDGGRGTVGGARRALAIICFAIVILAILFAVYYLVVAGQKLPSPWKFW